MRQREDLTGRLQMMICKEQLFGESQPKVMIQLVPPLEIFY